MSMSKHDSPFANSGLVVTVDPKDFGGSDVLAGVRLQQRYERRAFDAGRHQYLCPIQRATDFLAERRSHGALPSSYPRGVGSYAVAELVPPPVVKALRHGLPALDRGVRRPR